VQAELSRAVPPEVFATWLSATHLAELRDGTAIIATPNVFARDKLADDYLPLLTTTLQTVLGYPAQVQIVIGGGA
jgi:chromosomal replication initiator protein